MEEVTTTPSYQVPGYANHLFAAVYILTTVIGLPANIVSLWYFMSEALRSSLAANKAYFNIIYILIAVVDILVCITLFPVICSMMQHRDPALFGIPWFCYGWGFLWEMLPYMSVFLVGIMSISRTFILVKPMVQLRRRVLLAVVGVYLLFLVARTALPLLTGDATYMYWNSEVYCYEMASADWSYKFNSISRSVTLALPIVPICLSCVTSYIIILVNERRQSLSRKGKTDGGKNRQAMSATRTIIIFTGAYIVFNIPVFVNYVLMAISSWSSCENDCYLVMFGSYPFLIWYSWNFSYVLCPALNSMVNPIIYYWRMQPIQSFVNDTIRRTSKRISSSWQPQIPEETVIECHAIQNHAVDDDDSVVKNGSEVTADHRV